MSNKIALVLGGAANVWEDVEEALELGEYAGVVTCNDVTARWPGEIEACVSMHAESWPRWLSARAKRPLPAPKRVVGHLEFTKSALKRPDVVTDWVDWRLPGQTENGSSGLFALKVALVDLGFDRAVLCGVPMDAERAHFFDPRQWQGAMAHRGGWTQALPAIRDRARSMSGWTRELLGAPAPDWLA